MKVGVAYSFQLAGPDIHDYPFLFASGYALALQRVLSLVCMGHIVRLEVFMALVDPEIALENILSRVEALPPEKMALSEALGRVGVMDILAQRAHPRADNSAMDGFAVRAEDVQGATEGCGQTLKLVGRSRAGEPFKKAVGKGEAARIFTGAILPPGANAVVMQENTDYRAPASVSAATVTVWKAVGEGENIRRAGEEYQKGDLLFPKGERVRPATIGLLAGDGNCSLYAHGQPRVAIIGTGDELIAPEDADDKTHSVIDGNSPMLAAASEELGARVVSLERVGDEPDVVADSLKRACMGSDIVLSTGGASVGEHDVIPEAWERAGIETIFWKVAIKPGKPLRFGVFQRSDKRVTLVFALPGNPLSALTNFELFVHPALRALSGAPPTRAPELRLPMAHGFKGTKGRVWYVRAGMGDGEGPAIKIPQRQGSNMLRAAATSALVAQIPAHTAKVEEGMLLQSFVSPRDLEGMLLEPQQEEEPLLVVEGGSLEQWILKMSEENTGGEGFPPDLIDELCDRVGLWLKDQKK